MGPEEEFRALLEREYRKGASVEQLAMTYGIPESVVKKFMEGVEPRCCDEPTCPRKELSRRLTPNDPVEAQVARAAKAMASSGIRLNDEDLRVCFRQCFDLSDDCVLFQHFVESYRAHRNERNFKASGG